MTRLSDSRQTALEGGQIRPRGHVRRPAAVQGEHPDVAGLWLCVVKGHVTANAARRDGQILCAVELVGNGTADNARAGLKLPKHRPRAGVESHEVAAHVSSENEPGRGGHSTSPKGRWAHRSPQYLAMGDVERHEVAGILAG